MQLLFTIEELNVLAALLEEREQGLTTMGSTAARQEISELLEKVLTQDLLFSCDEIDELADLVATCTVDDLCEYFDESQIAQKRQVLIHLADKLTEARAMA